MWRLLCLTHPGILKWLVRMYPALLLRVVPEARDKHVPAMTGIPENEQVWMCWWGCDQGVLSLAVPGSHLGSFLSYPDQTSA